MAIGFYSATVTTDENGDGTSSDWNGKFVGELLSARIEFGASPDAGTDTTLTAPRGAQHSYKTWTNTNSDGTVYPMAAVDGATDAYRPFYVDSSNLLVTVDEGGNSKTVTVIVEVREL